MCLGARVAELEIYSLLAAVLQSEYTYKQPPSTPTPTTNNNSNNTTPQHQQQPTPH